MSWIAGILCTGVIVGLFWFAIPIVPTLVAFVGDTLRSLLA